MSDATPPAGGYAGPAWLRTGSSSFNAMVSVIRAITAGQASGALVKVLAVHGGGVGAPPSVDVQPMVNQIDGFGQQTPHGKISGLPCFRLQGGGGAVILDPVVGDIGVAVICDRDISTVKATGKISGPGSYRQNDWADGCYFGSFLGGTPTNYVAITPSGINIVTTGTITISATNATLDASGNLMVMGDIVAGNGGADSVTLQHHLHTSAAAGDPTSAPTPGT
jgi:hypothetical protein